MDAVVFQIGLKRYAVELLQIAEVLSLGPVTPVPSAPPALMGAMNLRGQVVAVLEARALLAVTDAPVQRERIGLLVQADGFRAVLCVDRVEGVMPIAELGAPPPILLELGALLKGLLEQLEANGD